jgi:hypothetical protein
MSATRGIAAWLQRGQTQEAGADLLAVAEVGRQLRNAACIESPQAEQTRQRHEKKGTDCKPEPVLISPSVVWLM